MINQFTIITGLSGAGRSSTLKCLEDMGFFCVDNLPPTFIPGFAEHCLNYHTPLTNVATVVDVRMGDMFEDIYDAVDKLKSMPLDLELLFLDASDETLLSRFKQTNRKHPLSKSGKVITGITDERVRLQRIKEMSNLVLDTSVFNASKLRQTLEDRYTGSIDTRLLISVITFGYKRGIPMDADLVFDVRFIKNPFYIEELRKSTGLNEDVSDYVLQFEVSQYFLTTIVDLVKNVLPSYIEQNKKQLVIGVGCTGGMHRSVAIGEELFARLSDLELNVSIEHRDLVIEKNSVMGRIQSEPWRF